MMTKNSTSVPFIFRYDDFGADENTNKLNIEKKLIELHIKYKIPLTMAVIPHLENLLNKDKTRFNLLLKGLESGWIYPALHGYFHRSHENDINSEFEGLSYQQQEKLIERGKAAYRLDGDNVRHGLNNDLGFSPEDRNENIRRISEVAALFKNAGVITLAAFISPYRQVRDEARNKIGDKYFHEVYVKADVETCAERDPKGLYDKAFKGEIDNFTGVSAPYEEPDNPELVIDTRKLNIKESVNKVLNIIDIDYYGRKVAQ